MPRWTVRCSTGSRWTSAPSSTVTAAMALHSAARPAAISDQLVLESGRRCRCSSVDSIEGDFGSAWSDLPDTVAVLGLLTTKEATVEERGHRGRKGEAATVKALDELALSTQCGFASAANAPMSDDDERAKLQIVGDQRRTGRNKGLALPEGRRKGHLSRRVGRTTAARRYGDGPNA